jgi:hypothetical protein
LRERTRVSIIRGAGIGFALASFLFVLTWRWFVFLLVPAGALAGLGLSRLPERAPRAPKAVEDPRSRRWLQRTLVHPNLLVRFTSLFVLAGVLLLAAWLIGYHVLPEGALRTAGAAQLTRGGLDVTSESVVGEWLRIFTYNLIPVVLTLLANLVLRVNGVPLGYIVPLYNVIGYGLFLGTNSFAIPYPQRLAPTLAILGRSGPYEMTALVAVAAATATWSRYQVRSLFRTNPEPVASRPRIRPSQMLLFALGLILLVVANWIEASMIVAAS